MSTKDRKLKGNGASAGESPTQPSWPKGQRELIGMAKLEVGLRATHDGVASVSGVDVSSTARLLSREDVLLNYYTGYMQKPVTLAEHR